MIKGPIVIVEDDIDDQEIYADAIKSIGINNELRFFDGPPQSAGLPAYNQRTAFYNSVRHQHACHGRPAV